MDKVFESEKDKIEFIISYAMGLRETLITISRILRPIENSDDKKYIMDTRKCARMLEVYLSSIESINDYFNSSYVISKDNKMKMPDEVDTLLCCFVWVNLHSGWYMGTLMSYPCIAINRRIWSIRKSITEMIMSLTKGLRKCKNYAKTLDIEYEI